MNILITGSRAPVAMELARRFHQRGHEVFQADSLPAGIAMRSNTVTRSYVVPRPVDGLEKFIGAVAKIVADQQIDLLIPTCEEVFFLAARADRLQCRLFLDGFDLLARIHDKWEFSRFAGNRFATVPETRLIEDASQLAADSDLREIVLKPAYSRFAARTLIGPEAAEIAKLDVTRERWIAQRRIRGTEYSSYSIAVAGELKAHCTYQSLYRVGTGSGICFQTVDLPDAESFVAEFVREHQYTGQIGFDLMRDSDSRLWVIEGNPRATSGVQLFAAKDPLVDAILESVDSTSPGSDVVRPSINSLAMIEFAMPFWGLADAVRRRQLSNFLRDSLRARWLCFSWRDPWPALGMPASFWPLIRIALTEGCSLQEASTLDVEWNGEDL